MTVAIDVSDIRSKGTVKSVPLDGLLPRSRRLVVTGALGGLGLIVFAYGAFSFFGDLADPRTRMPRPRAMAAPMPDLRDGLPDLVPARLPAAVAVAGPSARQAPVSQPVAAHPAVAAPPQDAPPAPVVSVRPPREDDATGSLARRPDTGPAPAPLIETAATDRAEPRQAPVIAPLRLSKPLAPAKGETVRAKPSDRPSDRPSDDRGAVASVSRPPEGRSVEIKPVGAKSGDTKSVAARTAEPEQADGGKRQAGAKPVRERPTRSASAEPAPAAARVAPARRAAEDESDDLSAKVSKGIKAIGGLFDD